MEKVILNPAMKSPWISSAPIYCPVSGNRQGPQKMNSVDSKLSQNWVSDVVHKEKTLVLVFPFISPSYIRLALKMSGYDFKISYKFLSSKLLHNLDGRGNELLQQAQGLLTKKLHSMPKLLEKKNCIEQVIDLTVDHKKSISHSINMQEEYPVIVIPDDDDTDEDSFDQILLDEYETFKPKTQHNNLETLMINENSYVKIPSQNFNYMVNKYKKSQMVLQAGSSSINKISSNIIHPGISSQSEQQLSYNIFADNEEDNFNPNDKVGIILRKIKRLNEYKVSLL